MIALNAEAVKEETSHERKEPAAAGAGQARKGSGPILLGNPVAALAAVGFEGLDVVSGLLSKTLARRLEGLESQLLPEPETEPIIVQIVYVSPDGSSEDGERYTTTNPGPRFPDGKRRR